MEKVEDRILELEDKIDIMEKKTDEYIEEKNEEL
jgi:hypothetical protein